MKFIHLDIGRIGGSLDQERSITETNKGTDTLKLFASQHPIQKETSHNRYPDSSCRDMYQSA